MTLHAVTPEEAEADRIRAEFDRFEELLHIAVRRGVISTERRDAILLDRALTDSCRIVALGVRP